MGISKCVDVVVGSWYEEEQIVASRRVFVVEASGSAAVGDLQNTSAGSLFAERNYRHKRRSGGLLSKEQGLFLERGKSDTAPCRLPECCIWCFGPLNQRLADLTDPRFYVLIINTLGLKSLGPASPNISPRIENASCHVS